MQRVDLQTGLGGHIAYVKFSLTYADFSTAGLTQTIQLQANPGGIPFQTPGTTAATINPQNFQIPQGGQILYVRFKSSVQFAAAAATSAVFTLQKTGGTNFTTPGTIASGNLFGAVADTGATLAEFTGFAMSQHSAFGLCVLLTTIGGNISTLTAGQVDLYIAYLNVSTATSTTSSGV